MRVAAYCALLVVTAIAYLAVAYEDREDRVVWRDWDAHGGHLEMRERDLSPLALWRAPHELGRRDREGRRVWHLEVDAREHERPEQLGPLLRIRTRGDADDALIVRTDDGRRAPWYARFARDGTSVDDAGSVWLVTTDSRRPARQVVAVDAEAGTVLWARWSKESSEPLGRFARVDREIVALATGEHVTNARSAWTCIGAMDVLFVGFDRRLRRSDGRAIADLGRFPAGGMECLPTARGTLVTWWSAGSELGDPARWNGASGGRAIDGSRAALLMIRDERVVWSIALDARPIVCSGDRADWIQVGAAFDRRLVQIDLGSGLRRDVLRGESCRVFRSW